MSIIPGQINLKDFRKSALRKVIENKIGGAGHRSRYLAHAKRALYHLSYTPMQRRRRCWCFIMRVAQVFKQNLVKIGLATKRRTINSCSNLTHITGGAGHRSRYLAHAKRALYHLSYTPMQRRRRCWCFIMRVTLVFYQNLVKIGLVTKRRSINSCSNLTHITGGAGHRSRYLAHAKRALYHLSYTPMQRRRRCWCFIMRITLVF